MPEPTSIVAMIAAIKHSIDIAKDLKDADSTLEKAELKLKIAELIGSLADAKTNATEFQELLQEKDKRITELEDLLRFKEKLVRKQGLYVVLDENGNTIDGAYCPICWETEEKAVHLTFKYGGKRISCFSCKNAFGTETGRSLHGF